jgi:hypothetical protein
MSWQRFIRGGTGFKGPVTSYYAQGQWNAVCDLTSQVAKSGDMVRQWNGLYVRKEAADEPIYAPHPQDAIPGVVDDFKPDWARPNDSNTFLNE